MRASPPLRGRLARGDRAVVAGGSGALILGPLAFVPLPFALDGLPVGAVGLLAMALGGLCCAALGIVAAGMLVMPDRGRRRGRTADRGGDAP